MEDKNKQVNLPPADGEQEEGKKKGIGAGLFSRSSGMRGSWGAMLAKFTASKTAVVAVALGVTALAGLATMTVTSKKSDVGGGSGEMLAFSPYERYTPGAGTGGDSAVFPLPYAEGNAAYKDELYSASVSPNAARSERAAEYSSADAAADVALPTAAAGAAGLRAGNGSSGSRGGGSASVMSSSGKNAASAAKAAAGGAAAQAKLASALSGAGRSGAAVSKQGNTRGSRLATGGIDPMKNKSAVGVPLVGSAELAKAKSDVKFGETPVAGSGSVNIGDPNGAAEQNTDTAADSFEMPTAPSDTSSSSSAGGGGGGGGGSDDAAAMAEKLKQLTTEAGDLLQQLLDLATDEDKSKLCADGTMAAMVELISEKSTEIIEQLDTMGEAQAMTAAKVANWKCNIAMQMVDVVSTFAKDSATDYCTKYLTRENALTNRQKSCIDSYAYTNCEYWNSQVNTANPAWENAQQPFVDSLKPMQTFKTKLDSELGIKTLLMMGQSAESTSTATGAAADTCPFEVQG